MYPGTEEVVFDGWHRERGADDAAGRRGGRRRLLAVSAVVVAVPMIWTTLTIGPGLLWEGTAVWEPCEAKVEQLFGKAGEVRVVREDVHVEWLPPRWVCPLSNGDAIHP